ncbi:ABC transporter permease [Microbulbifer bruguierae]|uniref:ABC transporter permease n=1 Tax=Microbulbifer bruguierae TaxID=3029061 RepID=A0ABY8NE62_9GAMM|nr:ABC transporter permease [Microbulbifer bruguierae]WGL17198.1 ABC transporter permease [Microbulbifer bruguierae]
MGLGPVFLSHYRRYPGQLAGLLLILICAAMLWSGVRSLTGAAEKAVARSQAALEPLLQVVRADGRAVTIADFAQLRRLGLCATPRLNVRFDPIGSDTDNSDRPPQIVGIDPFSAPCIRQYAQARDEPDGVIGELVSGFEQPMLLGSAGDLKRWRQLSRAGAEAFQYREVEGLPNGQLLADISVAAELATAARSTLAILLPAAETDRVPLPNTYRAQVWDYGVKPTPLVDAFLLSLDALGALALLVAALLVRSVYRFALVQRRRSLDILLRLGVPPPHLRTALICEVLLIAVVGSSIGLLLGGWLASALAEGFQGTLQGLFSIDSLAVGAPKLETWLGMVFILAVVVAWACADLLKLPGAVPGGLGNKSQAAYDNTPPWDWLTALVAVAVSLVPLLLTDRLWLVYLSALGCLVGVGLLLPLLLNRMLGRLQAWAERQCLQPLLEWSCSEMRALCRLLQLPLTALAFAIATAIGVHAMVTGFETTFARWLDQRLRGDLYLDPGRALTTAEWSQWRARLQDLPGVSEVLPMVRGRGLLGETPVDVLAVDPDSPLLRGWRFLDAVPNPWMALGAGGVLINEQLARRQSLAVGAQVRVQLAVEQKFDQPSDQPSSQKYYRVIGIYADYGRPEGELLLPLTALPDVLPDGYSTFVIGLQAGRNHSWRDWSSALPWLSGSHIRDQAELKRAATVAFNRTFEMTRILNGLTLSLAGVALLLMGLVTFRLRRNSYTLLSVYGIPRASLRRRLIAHSMLVTGLLALLAIPLGIFLAWVLVARVNPAAFGWALPLHLYPGFWCGIWLLSLGIGALVGVLAGNPVRLETMKSE